MSFSSYRFLLLRLTENLDSLDDLNAKLGIFGEDEIGQLKAEGAYHDGLRGFITAMKGAILHKTVDRRILPDWPRRYEVRTGKDLEELPPIKCLSLSGAPVTWSRIDRTAARGSGRLSALEDGWR